MRNLSPRERDVLATLGAGHTLKSAAKELGISNETAKTYAAKIRIKWDVRTNTQAVALAARNGLI